MEALAGVRSDSSQQPFARVRSSLPSLISSDAAAACLTPFHHIHVSGHVVDTPIRLTPLLSNYGIPLHYEPGKSEATLIFSVKPGITLMRRLGQHIQRKQLSRGSCGLASVTSDAPRMPLVRPLCLVATDAADSDGDLCGP